MPVVVLIPTGKLEHLALKPALERVFHGHEFRVFPPENPLNGFTSCDVALLERASPGPIPTNLEELAAALVNAILPARKGERADFAYVVEDLELVNQHQAETVLRVFRNKVKAYIDQTWSSKHSDRIRHEVRDRCSFHLFRPMVEAYFFGDQEALRRAQIVWPVQIPDNSDLEQFRTTDRLYLDLPSGSDPVKDMPSRELHPKSYLHYLCDPTLADKKKRYRETKQGAAALAALDWERVLQGPPHCPFLHAFLEDLGEALGCKPTYVTPDRADPRARFAGRLDRVLRNV